MNLDSSKGELIRRKKKSKMLTENEVLEKLSTYLRDSGHEILQQASTAQRGVDLVARKDNRTWYIEAKGATSSKKGTNRYGKPFNASQVRSHVSRAILQCMKTLNGEAAVPGSQVGIALPDNEAHRNLVAEIYPSLKKLDITLFWVSAEEVREE